MSTFRIGLVRLLPRHSVEDQTARIQAGGCDRLIVEGAKLASGKRADWAWFIQSLRKGDIVVVANGRVVLQPQKGDETPRKRFFRGLGEIEDAGASVETADGKLHTRDRKSRDAFAVAVLDAVALARKGGDSGRPKNRPTADEIAWMTPIWQSLKIATNKAACDMIRAEAERRDNRRWRRVSVQQLMHKLGPSGRVALRRKPAAKTKLKR